MFVPLADLGRLYFSLGPGRGVLPGAADRGVIPRFLVPLGVREDDRCLRDPFGVRDEDFLRLVPLGVREPERCFREPRGVREPERALVDRPRGVEGRGVFRPCGYRVACGACCPYDQGQQERMQTAASVCR